MSLFLEVVTPQNSVMNTKVQSVIAVGAEGEFGVLEHHTTFLTSLAIGALRYKDENGKEDYLFVNGGFAEVLPDKVTILAESAEKGKDIDAKRATKAKQRATKLLEDKKADTDILRAQVSLQRALSRLFVKDLVDKRK